MSIFSASSASQPAPTDNPFSNLASSQPTQNSGLPSGLATSRPQQQSSLLSGFGGQANPPPSLSAFGALGSSQAQSTTTSGGLGTGLSGFSQLGSSRPQQTQNNPAATQPFGSSLFASQQQSQNQNGQPSDANLQQPTGLAKASQPAYFNSLLEKGKKRAPAADGGPAFGDLPSLQLSLEDIARRARELGGLGPQDKGPTNGKASAQR